MTTPNITKTHNIVLNQSSIDSNMFMKDIESMFPPILSSQMVALIDSGKNISNIIPMDNKNIELIGNSNGNSNGNQTDFSNTSKKYSPYVYYNKNLSEKFM